MDAYSEVLIPQADTNGDNAIAFDEFMTIFKSEKGSFGDSNSTRKYFEKFDKDDDGFISKAEFKKKIKSVMNKLGKDINNDEVKNAFKIVDTNGDGELSLDEFEAMPNLQLPKCLCCVIIVVLLL